MLPLILRPLHQIPQSRMGCYISKINILHELRSKHINTHSEHTRTWNGALSFFQCSCVRYSVTFSFIVFFSVQWLLLNTFYSCTCCCYLPLLTVTIPTQSFCVGMREEEGSASFSQTYYSSCPPPPPPCYPEFLHDNSLSLRRSLAMLPAICQICHKQANS